MAKRKSEQQPLWSLSSEGIGSWEVLKTPRGANTGV